MTSDEYRGLLKRLGLSQVAAASLLRVNPVTSRRWAKYGITGIADLFLSCSTWTPRYQSRQSGNPCSPPAQAAKPTEDTVGPIGGEG
jgi:hypothetical protein